VQFLYDGALTLGAMKEHLLKWMKNPICNHLFSSKRRPHLNSQGLPVGFHCLEGWLRDSNC
jgi:hypothetical protein